MESKEEKVLVEIDDSDAETFLCAICMEYKPMHSRSYCQGCPHYFCFSCIMDHISYRVLGGSIPVRCPEPGCTIGELTYEFWYKHVVDDVRNAWTAATSRDASILRCGSCGQFLEGITVEEMEDVGDERVDTLQRLAIARSWRPCPNCSIFIEWTGGCSIITCW
ncbi:hypothetical protein E2562_021440 [Oryza meyeriana var. granulata]|uniref:RING-type domain-containing protein n=1 Tax=Oryza meyeriana var. granulata TaxID=110450 RepID=A0A6G1C6K6_9ORYZ|nr:hypothetical protein E2562_021440 [Oryza meyeriana var. granulata]